MSETAESYVIKLLENPYLMAFIKITLSLYAAKLAPELPASVTNVFKNTFVKILAVFLIGYLGNVDFQLAILLAIVFVIGSNIASGRGALESFANYSSTYAKSNQKLIEPRSIIYPGCHNITMNDLINAFDQDRIKLQNTIMTSYQQLLQRMVDKNSKERLMKIAYATGLPYNVEFNDENAPLIATILVYNGFKISDLCSAPSK